MGMKNHSIPDWISDAFRVIDSKDAAAFAALIREDGSFRFGSSPAVQGRAAILAYVAGFFSAISALNHRLDQVWEGQGSWVVRGEVEYTRMNGTKVRLPFANILEMSEGSRSPQIAAWLIYADASPLFKEG